MFLFFIDQLIKQIFLSFEVKLHLWLEAHFNGEPLISSQIHEA